MYVKENLLKRNGPEEEKREQIKSKGWQTEEQKTRPHNYL
jgi:hypothetical protein